MGILVVLLAVSVSASWAADDTWLEQLTELVREHQAVADQHGWGSPYDVYLRHLNKVRQTLRQGDAAETYRMMNQFMDMLEARTAGIPAWSANALFDYCGTITPPMYHDVSRHLPRA